MGEVRGVSICSLEDMIGGLGKGDELLGGEGCKVWEEGMEELYGEEYRDGEIKGMLNKVYGGSGVSKEEMVKLKWGMVVGFGEMDWEKGWREELE